MTITEGIQMRKPAINFSIDIAAFIAFMFLMSTGFLVYWMLPAGSGNSAIWGLTRHDWGDIHFWIAIVFVTLIATHFILHWKWIKNMVMGKVKNQKITRVRITVAALSIVILLVLALAPFFSSIDDSDNDRGRNHAAVEVRK